MGRPLGTKNKMKSPEEKEQIVLDYLRDKHQSGRKTADKYGVSYALFCNWLKRYRENGIDGFKSQTGKAKHPNKGNPYCSLQRKKNKTREQIADELEEELERIDELCDLAIAENYDVKHICDRLMAQKEEKQEDKTCKKQ